MADAKVLEIVLKARDEASRVVKSVGDTVARETNRFKQLTATMKIAGAAITAASGAMAVGITAMAKSGARLIDVERSFRSLAETAGRSSQELLREFQAATKGTVDNATMMKNAVRASMLGIPIDKMATLMKIARQQAVAMGEDMSYMLESIVTGIGRASPMILDNLGITLKMGEVYEQAAKKLGKKADALTDAERKQALLNAVIEWGAQKEKELGGEVESAADSYAQMQANLTNLKNELAKAFVPVLADVAKWVAEMTKRISEVNPNILRVVAVVVAAGTAFGLIIGPIMLLIGLIPSFVAGLGMIVSALGAIVAAIGVVSLPIMTLIGLFVLWQTNMFGFRDTVINVFNVALASITNFVNGFIGWIQVGIETMVGFVQTVVNSVMEVVNQFNWLWSFIGQIFNLIFSFIFMIMQLIYIVIYNNLSITLGVFTNIFNAIYAVVEAVWNRIGGQVMAGINLMKNVIVAGFNFIYGRFVWLSNTTSNIISNMWNAIVSRVKAGVEAVKKAVRDMANSIASIIRSIHIPSFHVSIEDREVSGFKIKVPKISFYQFGGWVKNAGLAYLHPGEFVMSRGMIEGRRQLPPQITNNQPITINAEIKSDIDLNMLGYKLAWILRNTR